MAAEDGTSFGRTASQIALAVIAVIVGVLLYNRIWGDSGGDDDDARPVRGGDDTPAEVDGDDAEVTTTFADPGSPVEPTCPPAEGVPEEDREVRFSGPPPMCIDPALTYVAVVTTNRGFFEITLDTEAAPLASNNFVFLARWGFYEGVAFHRIIPDFVVQGGDATGGDPENPQAGYGDAGYEFADELPTTPPYYPLMSVAMANSGANTNGSQFFIVVGPQGEALPPQFTRFGSVTAGTPVVERIAETADPNSSTGVPRELTVIEDITVEER